MKTKLIFLIILITVFSTTYSQAIDTLSVYSAAFKEQRTVYIHKPETYKYNAESVKLPVIYLLDGQHEWFISPILSDIKYLQYTHEIPNALIVVIPHKNRSKECGIKDLNTELQLHNFITKELNKHLKKYNANNFKVIIGHSFSASFALYSYYHNPEFYNAVIAHTPLNKIESLVNSFLDERYIKGNISISVGGISKNKDYHHRSKYDELKEKYPDFFKEINTFEADNSAHNAVPIIATPIFLTDIFQSFSSRFSEIAKVDNNYKLIIAPEILEKEIKKIKDASRLGNNFFPPEIAELNGLASRYLYSNYKNIALEVYKLGIEYYPNYYGFHLSLYDLLLNKDKKKAKFHLQKTESLLKNTEGDWQGKDKLLKKLKDEKNKNGW